MIEREQLKEAIAVLKAQRAILGDAVVDAALGSMRQQLADLELTEREPVPALEGERKLVTIMFADISGFTALAEAMDPEAVRDLINACFDHLVPVVEKYGGTVDKFVGDAIVALFGAPVAHENDPERALRAALEMRDELAAFNVGHDTNLGLHFGINTGLVIAGGIGSEGRQDYSVMGDAVNVASRLEEVSERGEILVGLDAYRLTAPLFEFEALEPVQVKGKAEPMAVYRLLGLKAVPGAVRGIAGLRSPLVGRGAEFEQLEATLRALGQGQGSKIAIIAEAGLGKSRLVADVRQAHREGLTWAEGRALSYTQGMGYWAARDVLHSLMGIRAEAPPDEVGTVLRSSFERLLPEQVVQVYPYLAHLLGLSLDEAMAQRIKQLPPPVLQERMLRAFSNYVRARSLGQPLVLVWEDLHWADSSSLNLLETLLSLAGEAPLLLLLVFRPEGERIRVFHQQAMENHGEGYQVLKLAPLTRDESTQLVQNLLRIENLPAETRQLILDKAEGNPFFLEELLRALIDAGLVVRWGEQVIATQAIKDMVVPDTLQGVIAARIDRLPMQDKRALQTASVIGRVFQHRVLTYMAEQERASDYLDASLSELQRREFIRLREVEKQEYIFKHVLTQDVTYHSLLIAQRKVLHKVAGEAIEALFPDQLDELAATLAYHFEKAEVPDKAVAYLQQAGDRAVRLSAHEEAIAHLTKGLELLKTLPDTPECIQQELALQVALGVPLISTKGYAAPEAEKAYARARELCQQVRETSQLSPVLRGLWGFYNMRAEYQTARELGEQLLTLGQSVQDPALLLEGHRALGMTLFVLGELTSAQAHLEQGIALYDPQQHRSHAFLYGQDPGVAYLSQAAWVLCLLGYPDQAMKRIHDALTLAQELAHPFSLAGALFCAAVVHQLRREGGAAQERAEAAITLSTEQGFPFFLTMGTILRGWALAEQGQLEEGISQMRRGLVAYRATGAEWVRPHYLALLAEAYGKRGQAEEGLTVLADALAVLDNRGERRWEAELYRLKGELLLMQGEDESDTSAGLSTRVEGCFRQAIDVARSQSAKSLELQAMMSLSCLWQQQGKPEEARKLLAEIYGWFTEGFGTADLREAQALLKALS